MRKMNYSYSLRLLAQQRTPVIPSDWEHRNLETECFGSLRYMSEISQFQRMLAESSDMRVQFDEDYHRILKIIKKRDDEYVGSPDEEGGVIVPAIEGGTTTMNTLEFDQAIGLIDPLSEEDVYACPENLLSLEEVFAECSSDEEGEEVSFEAAEEPEALESSFAPMDRWDLIYDATEAEMYWEHFCDVELPNVIQWCQKRTLKQIVATDKYKVLRPFLQRLIFLIQTEGLSNVDIVEEYMNAHTYSADVFPCLRYRKVNPCTEDLVEQVRSGVISKKALWELSSEEDKCSSLRAQIKTAPPTQAVQLKETLVAKTNCELSAGFTTELQEEALRKATEQEIFISKWELHNGHTLKDRQLKLYHSLRCKGFKKVPWHIWKRQNVSFPHMLFKETEHCFSSWSALKSAYKTYLKALMQNRNEILSLKESLPTASRDAYKWVICREPSPLSLTQTEKEILWKEAHLRAGRLPQKQFQYRYTLTLIKQVMPLFKRLFQAATEGRCSWTEAQARKKTIQEKIRNRVMEVVKKIYDVKEVKFQDNHSINKLLDMRNPDLSWINKEELK